MKKQTLNSLTSCRYKVLTASIAACMTALVATSVSQASDIDIYQNAKSGDVTLMFTLDISGSMGAPQLYNDDSDFRDSCDLPSGVGMAGKGRELSTNGSPSYYRYYCEAVDTPTYKYRTWTEGRRNPT